MNMPNTNAFILYGAPVSLYTGKVRAFLRKHADVCWEEQLPTTTRYSETVLPQIKRPIIPVLETPDGRVIQDTTDIIDFMEANGLSNGSVYPDGPVRRAFALMLEAFGDEALLRQAMHYRWSYREQNLPFLKDQFAAIHGLGSAPRLEHGAGEAESGMDQMARTLKPLGVYGESIPEIESVMDHLLDALQIHFSYHPYLLGPEPTIADYGFTGPFFAHLARDPYPAALMKKRAPQVYRWTERINAPNRDAPEFACAGEAGEALIASDAPPETMSPVLSLAATYYVPEIKAVIDSINAWLAEHRPQARAEVHPKRHIRALGHCEFQYGRVSMRTATRPYMLYLHQRLTDHYDGLDAAAQTRVRDAFKAAGLETLLDLRADRRVERVENLEVWGDPERV